MGGCPRQKGDGFKTVPDKTIEPQLIYFLHYYMSVRNPLNNFMSFFCNYFLNKSFVYLLATMRAFARDLPNVLIGKSDQQA